MAPEEKESQEQPAPRPADSPHPALKLRHTLRGHTEHVYRMALSPDGRTLASPSDDKTVRLWDVESGRLLRTLEHQAAVVCVAWSPDGTTLASGGGSTDKKCIYGTPRPGDRCGSWESTAARSTALPGRRTGRCWRPALKTERSGSGMRRAGVRCENSKDTPARSMVLPGRRTADGSVPARGMTPSGCGMRRPARRSGRFTGHTGDVNCVAWSPDPDRQHIASGSDDRTVRIWDPKPGSSNTCWRATRLRWSPFRSWMAAACWPRSARTAR